MKVILALTFFILINPAVASNSGFIRFSGSIVSPMCTTSGDKNLNVSCERNGEKENVIVSKPTKVSGIKLPVKLVKVTAKDVNNIRLIDIEYQ